MDLDYCLRGLDTDISQRNSIASHARLRIRSDFLFDTPLSKQFDRPPRFFDRVLNCEGCASYSREFKILPNVLDVCSIVRCCLRTFRFLLNRKFIRHLFRRLYVSPSLLSCKRTEVSLTEFQRNLSRSWQYPRDSMLFCKALLAYSPTKLLSCI